MLPYSKEFRERMVEMFIRYGECKAVARELGVSSDTVKRWVQKSGIHTNDRSYSRSRRKNFNRYREAATYNEKSLAYICGFIAADGCLSRDSTSITIELQESDVHTLEMIRDTCIAKGDVPDFKIKYVARREGRPTNSPTVRIHLNLPKLYSDCLELGITPAKSLTLNPKLEGKSEDFLWYFLRGMLDGDGCVIVGKTLADCSIRLSSASPACVRTMQAIYGGTIAKGTTVENLQFKGALAKQLASRLPLDEITMERKTRKLKEILSMPAQAVRNSSVLMGTIWGVLEKPINMIDAWRQSDKLVTYETVKWRVYRGWTLEDAASLPKGSKCPIR